MYLHFALCMHSHQTICLVTAGHFYTCFHTSTILFLINVTDADLRQNQSLQLQYRHS